MYGVQGYHAYGLDKLLAALAKQVWRHNGQVLLARCRFFVLYRASWALPPWHAKRDIFYHALQLCHIVTDETSKSLSFLYTREKLPKGETQSPFWEALYRARAREKLLTEGEYLVRIEFVCWFWGEAGTGSSYVGCVTLGGKRGREGRMLVV